MKHQAAVLCCFRILVNTTAGKTDRKHRPAVKAKALGLPFAGSALKRPAIATCSTRPPPGEDSAGFLVSCLFFSDRDHRPRPTD